MSDSTFFILIVIAGVLALAVGVWIGLGYPGLYDRYENTGAHAPRVSPFRRLLGGLGPGGRKRDRTGGRGTGRWSRR